MINPTAAIIDKIIGRMIELSWKCKSAFRILWIMDDLSVFTRKFKVPTIRNESAAISAFGIISASKIDPVTRITTW
ncbi:MAG: hypothetical protein ACXACX_20355, partial [Candidatus Hodarchaeales archaeon]